MHTDKNFDRMVLVAICALLALSVIAFCMAWPVAQVGRPSVHAQGPIVPIVPVAKHAPVPMPVVAVIAAPTVAKASVPVTKRGRSAARSSGCDAECAAYLKAYRNAERANTLLGESRYDTGPLALLHGHHTL